MNWVKRKRRTTIDSLRSEMEKLRVENEALKHENKILASLCERARLWAEAEQKAYAKTLKELTQ